VRFPRCVGVSHGPAVIQVIRRSWALLYGSTLTGPRRLLRWGPRLGIHPHSHASSMPKSSGPGAIGWNTHALNPSIPGIASLAGGRTRLWTNALPAWIFDGILFRYSDRQCVSISSMPSPYVVSGKRPASGGPHFAERCPSRGYVSSGQDAGCLVARKCRPATLRTGVRGQGPVNGVNPTCGETRQVHHGRSPCE
jgi:hypothetical protein